MEYCHVAYWLRKQAANLTNKAGNMINSRQSAWLFMLALSIFSTRENGYTLIICTVILTGLETTICTPPTGRSQLE